MTATADALADLASTVALVDDIAVLVDRLNQDAVDGDYQLQHFYAARGELYNLRRRLVAIHRRLEAE